MHRHIECGAYVGWGRKKYAGVLARTHMHAVVCVCVSEKDER